MDYQVIQTPGNSLEADFIKLMAEIGNYGFEKHGEKSFQYLLRAGLPLDTDRLKSCMLHLDDHVDLYDKGILHDHFHTQEHQLAAIAYNAMMEYVRLREERKQDARNEHFIDQLPGPADQ